MNKYILQFRTLYLQAIAKAWGDINIYNELVTQVKGDPDYSFEGQTYGPCRFNKIYNMFQGEKEGPAIPTTNPWKYFSLNLINRQPTEGFISDPHPQEPQTDLHWDPDFTLDWIGPNGFIIVNLPQPPSLPEPPPEKNQKEELQEIAAQALAAYYEIFPTFLGPVHHYGANGGKEPSLQAFPEKSNEDNYIEPRMNFAAAPVASGESLGDQVLNFGGVTLRAIALAWEQHYRKQNDETQLVLVAQNQTIAGDKKLKEVDRLGAELSNLNFIGTLTNPKLRDATKILSDYFGYNNPWNFNILFRQPIDFTWNNSKNQWDNIPKNVVVLNFPSKPEEGVSLPIALSLYNLTGPHYAFTCT